MKILNFKDFAALPEGTIFSYFTPMICDGLYRKGQTIVWDGEARDFFEASLVACCWNGEHPTVDDTESRWGLYEYDQEFAVYEPDDIAVLIRQLTAQAPY